MRSSSGEKLSKKHTLGTPTTMTLKLISRTRSSILVCVEQTSLGHVAYVFFSSTNDTNLPTNLPTVGAQKTGTSTMHILLSSILSTSCCHNLCPERWDIETTKHMRRGTLDRYQCFGDNGDYSDYPW